MLKRSQSPDTLQHKEWLAWVTLVDEYDALHGANTFNDVRLAQFVNALKKWGETFHEFRQQFPKVSHDAS